MDSIEESKEIDIKYRACFYFDDILKVGEFDNIRFTKRKLLPKFIRKYFDLRNFIQNFYGLRTIV